MAYIFSNASSPLIFSRENEIFRNAINNSGSVIPSGVISDTHVYRGTSGLKFSVNSGYYFINGVLIHEDVVQEDVFDFTGEVAGSDGIHFLIYVKYNPDEDEEPQYLYEAGTRTTPVDIPIEDAPYSIKLADIWMENGAIDNTTSVINNVANIQNLEELSKNLNTQTFISISSARGIKGISPGGGEPSLNTGEYAFVFRHARILFISQFKSPNESGTRLPVGAYRIVGEENGSYDFDVNQLTKYTPGSRYIVFFVTVPDDWNGSTQDLVLRAFGVEDGEADDSPSSFALANILGNSITPDVKANIKNIRIVAVIDTEDDFVMMPNNGVLKINEDYLVNGHNSSYLNKLTSTSYLSTATVENGTLDLDDVMNNLQKLRDATLDTAYDGMAASASDGDGRIIQVTHGAVRLDRLSLEAGATPADDWMSTLNLNMSTNPQFAQFENGLVVTTPDNDGRQNGFIFCKHATVNGVSQANITCDLSYSGGQVRVSGLGFLVVDWRSKWRDTDYMYRHFIKFNDPGLGPASDQVYMLIPNVGGNYFYLQALDGTTDLMSPVIHFLNMPDVDVNCTIWEKAIEVSADRTTIPHLRTTNSAIIDGGEIRVGSNSVDSEGMNVSKSEIIIDGGLIKRDTATYYEPPHSYMYVDGPEENDSIILRSVLNYSWDQSVFTYDNYYTNVAQITSTGRYVYVVHSSDGGGTYQVSVFDGLKPTSTQVINTRDTLSSNVKIGVYRGFVVIGYITGDDKYRYDLWDEELTSIVTFFIGENSIMESRPGIGFTGNYAVVINGDFVEWRNLNTFGTVAFSYDHGEAVYDLFDNYGNIVVIGELRSSTVGKALIGTTTIGLKNGIAQWSHDAYTPADDEFRQFCADGERIFELYSTGLGQINLRTGPYWGGNQPYGVSFDTWLAGSWVNASIAVDDRYLYIHNNGIVSVLEKNTMGKIFEYELNVSPDEPKCVMHSNSFRFYYSVGYNLSCDIAMLDVPNQTGRRYSYLFFTDKKQFQNLTWVPER